MLKLLNTIINKLILPSFLIYKYQFIYLIKNNIFCLPGKKQK